MTLMDSSVSILQISDLHILAAPGNKLLGVDTERTYHAVLEHALAEHKKVDLILLSGDLAQEPCTSSYQRILDKLETYQIPSMCLPGNHDDYELMRRILNSGNINCQKQLFLKNWQIIGLNSRITGSDGGHLAADELQFLENCLQNNPGCPALIAVHHHCLKTGSAWMDTMMIDNAEEMLATVSRHPEVKAITCGHIHQQMDLHSGSIRILGTPSTCFQFKPKSKVFRLVDASPGYRMIELHADGRIESSVSHLAEKLTGLQLSGNY